MIDLDERPVVIDRFGRQGHRTPLEERLWPKVDKTGPRPVWRLGRCWQWTGALDHKGYGMIKVAGRLQKAHRVVYELVVGPIPAGLQVDHLCRNHGCVRPSHLEPVTAQVNTMRGRSPSMLTHLTGKCGKGHPRIPANLSARSDCLVCARARGRRWREGRAA